MGRTFGSFEAYKQDMSPRGSKAQYSHFLDKLTRDTTYFDSNVGNNIALQKKILAHKSKEQSTRAKTLCQNELQQTIQS